MISNKIFHSTLVLVLLVGTAMASPDEYEREEYYERRGPMPFEVFDLNQDGVVTAEEHAQVRRERQAMRARRGYPMRNAASAPSFEQIDTDKSGSISNEELTTWHTQRMRNSAMGWGGRWDD